MIDVISRGRLDIGFIKGVPYEFVPSNANPIGIDARFWEAHDLIIKAMTSHDGPFSWEGEHFDYRRSTSGRALISSRIRRSGSPPTARASAASCRARLCGGDLVSWLSRQGPLRRISRRCGARQDARGPAPDRFGYAPSSRSESEAEGLRRGNELVIAILAPMPSSPSSIAIRRAYLDRGQCAADEGPAGRPIAASPRMAAPSI